MNTGLVPNSAEDLKLANLLNRQTKLWDIIGIYKVMKVTLNCLVTMMLINGSKRILTVNYYKFVVKSGGKSTTFITFLRLRGCEDTRHTQDMSS